MSWRVEHHRGGVDALHHLEIGSPERRVMVMELDRPAVALGSTQSDAMLDGAMVAASGREVTRRHSGGGLVVLDPDDVVWIDVVIPTTDPLWRVDVGEAFVWLGRLWNDLIAERILPSEVGPRIHRGAPRQVDLGRVVCFAGVGSGEVLIGDRKIVGLSQRRTREWARFQCLVHGRFEPDVSMSLLAPHLTTGAFGERLRARLASGVGVVDLDGIVDDLLTALELR